MLPSWLQAVIAVVLVLADLGFVFWCKPRI